MCKLCWTLLGAAIIAAIVTVIMFASGNKTGIATDGREVIWLESHQRDLVLTEMRAFVESVRDITGALGAGDSEKIHQSALKVGLAAQQGVPLDMMKALPLSFKKLGMSTHKKFDEFAAHVEQGASNEELLLELSQLMNNCVACHAAYQIQSREPATKN